MLNDKTMFREGCQFNLRSSVEFHVKSNVEGRAPYGQGAKWSRALKWSIFYNCFLEGLFVKNVFLSDHFMKIRCIFRY